MTLAERCVRLCAKYPELVDRLVLTNCDAFEHFPPAAFRPIEAVGARVPGLISGLDLLLRVRAFRRALLAAAPLTVQLQAAFAAAGGPPKVLHMDNGPELISQALQQFRENKTSGIHPAGLSGKRVVLCG